MIVRVHVSDEELAAKTGNRCWYCGKVLAPRDSTGGAAMSIDYLVPLDQGGMPIESNTVACCKRCKAMKGDDALEQYRRRLWFVHIARCGAFTTAQMDYLKSIGFVLPEPDIQFYGEST